MSLYLKKDIYEEFKNLLEFALKNENHELEIRFGKYSGYPATTATAQCARAGDCRADQRHLARADGEAPHQRGVCFLP